MSVIRESPDGLDNFRQAFSISRQGEVIDVGSVLRASALNGYQRLVRELGGDPEDLLSRYDIPVGIEHQPDAFIPFVAYTGLLEVTAEELRCPDFGLRLVPLRGLAFAGPVAVIARNSETVLEALEAAARYMYVHTPALNVTIDFTGTHGRAVYELTEPLDHYPLQAMEASLGSSVRFGQMLTDAGVQHTVSLTHAQHSSDDAYREAYRCPVLFGQSWCGFEAPLAAATMRVREADPEASRIIAKFLEANYLPPAAPLSERVAERVRQLLATGLCGVDAIADQLAMHPRTLQRRLAIEGVTCQDVIDRERRSKAERYLAVADLHLGQIASLLGYTEQSAFNRSCRRWFGKTPREYRASLLADVR